MAHGLVGTEDIGGRLHVHAPTQGLTRANIACRTHLMDTRCALLVCVWDGSCAQMCRASCPVHDWSCLRMQGLDVRLTSSNRVVDMLILNSRSRYSLNLHFLFFSLTFVFHVSLPLNMLINQKCEFILKKNKIILMNHK